MNKEQAGRLLTLAYFMKTEVKKKHYDQNTVIAVPPSVKPEVALVHDNFCGSEGCSLGFLPIAFPKEFKYEKQSNYAHELYWEVSTHDGKAMTAAWAGKHREVLVDFFGLDEKEITKIFGTTEERDDGSYVVRTPKQQAKIIEKIVEKHGFTYSE